jgi:2-dehydro-3-deoxyphosphogluconate aldolase/(4S)-4-hydroxy-2-oxoglutarate aldolase
VIERPEAWDEVVASIKRTGLIVIIRGDFTVDYLLRLADALVAGGIPVVEVTMNSPRALEAITSLREHSAGRLLVGAGTVRSTRGASDALAAGAQFLISPNFDPRVVASARRAGVLHLPGVFTATEAQAAFAAGCRMLKLFPADAAGPSYLKALCAPLNDIEFVPTGGIHGGNLAAYVQAGAVAFGLGSSLVKSTEQDLSALTKTASELLAVFQAAKAGRAHA